MAGATALEMTDSGQLTVAFHINVPAESNMAGFTLKQLIVTTGRNVTQLSTGAGPGQISATLAAQIAAGDVIEILHTFPAESGGNTASLIKNVFTSQHAKIAASELNRLRRQLRWYGLSETVA